MSDNLIDRLYLRALPYCLRVLPILLNNGQNTSGNNAVGSAEVVVDFWAGQSRTWGIAEFVYLAVSA